MEPWDNIQESTVMKKLSAVTVAEQNRQYVEDRKNGLITSLKTKFPRLDNYLLGGIEPNSILCISAPSGAGKSTLGKCLIDSICQLNPNIDFNLYKFNFEMVSHQVAARSIVTASNFSLKKLYSIEEPLSDEEYKSLLKYYDELKKRTNVWFIETPSTPANIVNSLLMYYKKECREQKKTLVYEIDHTLLTKGATGENEKNKIDDLMYRLVELKKIISADGGNSIGIVITQMNREIRSPDRMKNAEMHKPNSSDLFGASSIEFCADYILFVHMPAKLGIRSYTQNEYPTVIQVGNQFLNMPYFELVKQRSGESDLTIPLWNKLSRFDFDEMDLELFKYLHKVFKETGQCIYNVNQTQKSLF